MNDEELMDYLKNMNFAEMKGKFSKGIVQTMETLWSNMNKHTEMIERIRKDIDEIGDYIVEIRESGKERIETHKVIGKRTAIYELRRIWAIRKYRERIIGVSPSRELILQFVIDIWNLERVNNFYLISPESKFYIHLDFDGENKSSSIDMIQYIEDHPERVGRIE